ncbi:selenide, water dikinase SelD, partial [Enterococcus faecalis]
MDFLSQCTSGGCGAKIESRVLNQLLQHLPETPANERLLVGFEHADDAAVYQITPEKALISTVDFFSPMVNDPLS